MRLDNWYLSRKEISGKLRIYTGSGHLVVMDTFCTVAIMDQTLQTTLVPDLPGKKVISVEHITLMSGL